MIIIGVLAAIAIPIFTNQRKKAQDSAAKADVSTIGKEVATYFVDNCQAPTVAKNAAGRYEISAAASATATCTNAAYPLTDLGKASDNVTLLATVFPALNTDTTWCVGVQNLKGDKQNFKYSAANGLEQGTC
jgi:type II secretory pathway pseudopilin PulG